MNSRDKSDVIIVLGIWFLLMLTIFGAALIESRCGGLP